MDFVKFMFIMIVGCLASASGAQDEHPRVQEALAGLMRHIERERLLLQELERQQELTAQAKAQRRQLHKEKMEKQMLLQEEVQQLEAELALQQQRASEAQAQAPSRLRFLRAEMQQAAELRRQEAKEANKATRRLCEALTEGRGDMRQLCRGAHLGMSPELAQVLHWLEQQQDDRADRKHHSISWPLVKLAALWAGWLAAVGMLWCCVQSVKTVKTD